MRYSLYRQSEAGLWYSYDHDEKKWYLVMLFHDEMYYMYSLDNYHYYIGF